MKPIKIFYYIIYCSLFTIFISLSFYLKDYFENRNLLKTNKKIEIKENKSIAKIKDYQILYTKEARDNFKIKEFEICPQDNNSKGEYVKGEAHTNGIEGTFGLFKRRIYGIHHQITRQHIEKYITSFIFYFNNKALSVAERFENAMNLMFSNNNLTYKILTGKEVDLRMYMRKY